VKKKKNFDCQVVVMVASEDVEKIELYAKKLRITRSQMIRNLIGVGLDSAELMNGFGIFSIVGFIRENNINPSEIMALAEK
jgi:hypothetical protein